MNDTDLKFEAINDAGHLKQFEILFTYHSNETENMYVVFTDHSKRSNGNIRAFASLYDPTHNESALCPVELDSEWTSIEEALDFIQNKADDKMLEELSKI